MKYNGFTNVGSMYQAKCKANELPIKFVKVKVGNGLLEETEDPAKFIDVKSLKKEVVISEKTQIEDAVRLTIQMDNDGVTEGYFPREFGIYVEDEGVEVLYWYVNDGNEASYLPSQSTAPVKLKNHFNIIATTLESLVVNWSGKEFWVDKEYLERKMEVNGNLTTDKINGLAGGYNGTFPLISAIKDNIYLLPATNKFYVCIENYSGSSLTVPNANFEELSVFQNRNKLENLFKKQWTHLKTFKMTQGCSFTLPPDWEELIIFEVDNSSFEVAATQCQIMQHKYIKNFMNEYPNISIWQRAFGNDSDYEAVLFNYNNSNYTFTQIKAVGGSASFSWGSANCISIYYK